MSDLDFLQAEQEEGGGSTYRIVGLLTFTPAYKVYAGGRTNEESLFPYTRAEDRRAAQQKANAFKSEAGAENDPDRVYAFIVPKDTVIAGGDNWNVDQYFLRSIWRDQLINPGKDNEIDDRIVFNSVKDHVRDVRMKLGVPFYGSLQLVPSPWHVRQGESGKTRDAQLQDGTTEKRWPTVAVLDVVYETEAEAKDAAAVFATDSNVPPKWNAKTWELVRSNIIKQFADLKAGGMPEAQAIATINASYELKDDKYVMAVLGIEFPV